MSEYEWEAGRLPKPMYGRTVSGVHQRRHPIADYIALEFPRESVTWVTNPSAGSHEPTANPGRRAKPKVAKKDSPSR